MANTYTQIHLHLIFAVRYRAYMIHDNWRDELHKYFTGIIQNNKHKVLAVNSMPDHVHILFGMRPHQALSDLMQDVKGSSSRWINLKHRVSGKFSWQEGYGAFSHSASTCDTVIRYIKNQQQHHAGLTLVDEYKQLLNDAKIEYDERYIFDNVYCA